MARNRMTGLRMFLPLGLVVALAVAWSAWWYAVYTTARSQYVQAEERLAAQGVTLGCAEQDWGGYPFRVEMTCSEPRLAVEREGTAQVVSATRVSALIQAYNPAHGLVLLAGPTIVSPGEGISPIAISHGLARASLQLIEDERILASAEIPEASAPGLGAASSILLHLRAGQTGQAELTGSASGLAATLPSGQEVKLDRAEFDVGAPVSLFQADDPLRQAAQTGSVLEIRRLELKQADLTVAATGSLSLDNMGRLNGKLSTTVSDFDLLLDRVSAQLQLKPEDVAAARSLLNLLKATGNKIDLVAREGKIYWGLIKLTEVPPLMQ